MQRSQFDIVVHHQQLQVSLCNTCEEAKTLTVLAMIVKGPRSHLVGSTLSLQGKHANFLNYE